MSEVRSDHIVLYEHNFSNNFFDLSNLVAGEILQKFTNYNIKIAIIGDFTKYPSKTFRDFRYECNKTKDHLFVGTLEEAIKVWQSE